MLKRLIPILFILILNFNSFAQTKDKKSSFGIQFHGFVNWQAFYDTRQMVEAREGMFTLYPKNADYDHNLVDMNSASSFQMLAMTTRLSANISGPDVFKAKSSALIEGDFTGVSNGDNNGFRLRHAYMKLNWENDELLIGHYWHPLDVVEVKVGTIALNSGAPMRSFSRFNQISYTRKIGLLSLLVFAGSERDYASIGPLGVSNSYQRNALIPNVHFQMKFDLENFKAGVGFDQKILRPRLETEMGFQTKELLYSQAFVAYGQYVYNDYAFKVQYIEGGNLTDHLMLGGYGEFLEDTMTGFSSYHNISQASIWGVIEKTKGSFRPGVFLGYAKNRGSDHIINSHVYSRGSDIDYVYRIGPRLSYWSGKLMVSAEIEYTVVAYGTTDQYMQVANSIEYANLRTLIAAFYFF
ncbi:MAG: hypothetical protein HOG05_00910 [Bacteroidetes bacterium]|nr:hypothetical protein [Bacteroidota bacterium]MBT5529709.1 hypothetical protein [Cytophagia bacterium]MBT3799688.1 hypothetical protein [Bacteroidota bacterium]MBT4968124.1 hypothetical protein [Bacteroidota bacterium]MBT5990953.1 hypothetical protein [Bacteroidota bacterium]